jgi:hypothetical protein
MSCNHQDGMHGYPTVRKYNSHPNKFSDVTSTTNTIFNINTTLFRKQNTTFFRRLLPHLYQNVLKTQFVQICTIKSGGWPPRGGGGHPLPTSGVHPHRRWQGCGISSLHHPKGGWVELHTLAHPMQWWTSTLANDGEGGTTPPHIAGDR